MWTIYILRKVKYQNVFDQMNIEVLSSQGFFPGGGGGGVLSITRKAYRAYPHSKFLNTISVTTLFFFLFFDGFLENTDPLS